ncbi:MAG: fascin domain-containing protein [Thermoanaerobaculia bacterium]
MSRVRRFAAVLLILLLAVPLQAAEMRDVLGSAHVGGRYSFTDQDFLNEGADRLLELGTRVIKVWFQLDASRAYPFNSNWGEPAADLAELARKPYYRRLFDKPFSTYILVISSFSPLGTSQWLDGMTPEEIDGEREHVYKLARHLLITYAGSGKTFVLQNWEGDHLLRQGLDGADPDPVRIQGMIDWWNARQDGVEQARREVGLNGVMVVHAAEVNLLAQAMEGKVTATNDVVPFTRADLYSYSSWDVGFDRRRLTQALDYLESKAPDSELFGERNIYLGEFGAVKDQVGEGVNLRKLIQGLADAALGWGVRWAVFWQLYCNEPKHEYAGRPQISDMRGFWLIRPDGSQAASWRHFQRRMPLVRHMARFSIATGQFLGAEDEDEQAVDADRWRPGPFTRFALYDLNGGPLRHGDKVTLQAHSGLYLTAIDGGGGPVLARSVEAGEDEVFQVWKVGGSGTIRGGDPIAFQTRSGLYLVAEPGTLKVTATRPAIGPAETFRLLLVPD